MLIKAAVVQVVTSSLTCQINLKWTLKRLLKIDVSCLGFWSGNFFLVVPFPDYCLLVPFHYLKFEPLIVINNMRFEHIRGLGFIFLEDQISVK